MKELLYLKDEQIKDFIQLLFYAYRETFSDPKKILSENSFGPAHLRALNLIERNPGTNLGELMFQLKITKQSLNRVLRDLIKTEMIKQINAEYPEWEQTLGSITRVLTNEEILNRDYYKGRFASVIDGKHVNNWE